MLMYLGYSRIDVERSISIFACAIRIHVFSNEVHAFLFRHIARFFKLKGLQIDRTVLQPFDFEDRLLQVTR